MLLLFYLLAQIPVNYGSMWTDPTMGLLPSTWYGQIAMSSPTRNIEVDGFRIPYTNDVSLFYSGSYSAEFDFFSVKFKKRSYNVTKPFTILNSERGYANYASAGFIFKQIYRKFSLSIVTNYSGDGFRKYSVVNPSVGYGNLEGYYYRFIQDTGRYFRLFYAGYRGKWNIFGIYGESVGQGRAFFHGYSIGKKFDGLSFSLTGEFLSNGKHFERAKFGYKSMNFAVVKPFSRSKVFPEFEYTYKLRGLVASIKAITVDSTYRAYFLAGVELKNKFKILAGYGRKYTDSGYENFTAGKMRSDFAWKNWHFSVAGRFYSEKTLSFDSLRLRTKLTFNLPFKRENYLKIAGIVDYFEEVVFSAELEVMLFKSVFVKVEEINLTAKKYPFDFPENGQRLYRISVAAILYD